MPQNPHTLVDPSGKRHKINAGEDSYAAFQRIQKASGGAPALPQVFSSPLGQQQQQQQMGGLQQRAEDFPHQLPEGKPMHPLAKLALEAALGTGVAAAIPPLGAAAAASKLRHIPGVMRMMQGAGKLSQPAKNAALGAVEGTVSTVPFAEEGDRLSSAAFGGVAGGALGAAVPAVASGVRGAYRSGRNLFDPEYAARKAAEEAAARASTPGSREILNKGGIVADVDPSLAAKVAGDAPRDVQDELFTGPGSIIEGRQLGAVARGAKEVEAVLPTKSRGVLDEIEASRKVEAEELYKPVYKQRIPDRTKKLIDDVWARDDVVHARKEAGVTLRNEYGEDAVVSPNSVESVHKVLTALREQAKRLKNGEHHDRARTVTGLYNKISNAMKGGVPGFSAAQDFAKGTFERQDAYEAGQHILHKEISPGVRNTVPYLKSYVEKLKGDPESLEFFRRGVIEKLVEGIEDSGVGDNVVRLFNNQGTRSKLQAVLPKDQYDNILDFVQRENAFSKTYKATRPKINPKGTEGEKQDALETAGNVARAAGWQSLFAYSNLAQNFVRALTGKGGDKYNRELMKSLSGSVLPSVPGTQGIGRIPGVGTLPATLNPRERQ